MSDDRFVKDPDEPTEEELLAERERRRILDGHRVSNGPTFRDVRSSVTASEIEGFLEKYCREMGIPLGKRAERVKPGQASRPTESVRKGEAMAARASNDGEKSEPSAPSAEDWDKLTGERR